MEPLWAMRVLLWTAAATTALFVGAANRRRGGRAAAMMLWGGVLTTLLAIDEAAQLHEYVIPALTGFPEALACSLYAGLAVTWIWKFRDEIRPPVSGWMLAATTVFAFAVGVDHSQAVEGTLKLAGVACWAVFFAASARAQLRSMRIAGELISLSQREQSATQKQLDATAGAMAELMAMAKEAAALRAEGEATAPASNAKARRVKLSDAVRSEVVR